MLGNLAREAGLACLVGATDAAMTEPLPEASASVWVALSRSRENLGEIGRSGLWIPCRTGPDSNTWTDDYSNIISVIGK